MTQEEIEEKEVFPSVDDFAPDEQGGPVARRGFTYQDYIAAKLVFDMICDPLIIKIHCETHDDILVVRQGSNDTRFAEFVQVKASEPDKLWSVADISQQKNKRAGTSIFEKSLSRDKASEVALFRIVTLRDVVKNLKPLTYPVGHLDRAPDSQNIMDLLDDLHGRFSDIKSEKGHGIDYWLANTRWEVAETQDAVKQALLIRIMKKSQQDAAPLLYEHAEKVLNNLLSIVKKAGDAKWVPDREQKILERAFVTNWWEESLLEEAQNRGIVSGGKLRKKMETVLFNEPTINLAMSLRRDYISETRTPRYMDEGIQSRLNSRVRLEAMKLQTEYNAGLLDMNTAEFHAECLKRLERINTNEESAHGDIASYLSGCLYDITDRCLFTFERQD